MQKLASGLIVQTSHDACGGRIPSRSTRLQLSRIERVKPKGKKINLRCQIEFSRRTIIISIVTVIITVEAAGVRLLYLVYAKISEL